MWRVRQIAGKNLIFVSQWLPFDHAGLWAVNGGTDPRVFLVLLEEAFPEVLTYNSIPSPPFCAGTEGEYI
jgi:hypothetical protein